MTKKILVKFLKILVSVLLVIWLIFSINWIDVLTTLKEVKIIFLAWFLFFYFAGTVVSAYKWKKLSFFEGFSFPFLFFFKTYLFGTLLNNFFPSTIGGDTFRSYELGKKDKRFKESSSTVVADRITGLLSLLFLAVLFGAIHVIVQKEYNFYLYIVAGMATSLALALFFIYFFHTKAIQCLLKILPAIVKDYFHKIISYRKPEIAFQSVLWSVIFSFVGLAMANYVLFLSVGIQLGLLNYLSVIFFISIASSAPISIGNIGVKEWAYITFFGLFGVTSSTAVVVVLLSRTIQLLAGLMFLPLYLKELRTKKHSSN